MSTARRRLAQAKRAAVRAAKSSAAWTLDLARRGERTVITTPQVGLRLGNFLYLWLQAHTRSAQGRPTFVLSAPGMFPWLEAFPGLQRLTIERADVRFSDRRAWDRTFLYQRFGDDFESAGLKEFVREVIEPQITPDESGAVVVNVRRGDYYTDFLDKYSFDQLGYVEAAMDLMDGAAAVRVVSDDPRWCRENLDEMLRRGGRAVTYDQTDPLRNFLALGGASRLIGSNSTFSYWGAYVATAIRADSQVIMPRFHARLPDGTTDAHQLDPRWTAIDGYF